MLSQFSKHIHKKFSFLKDKKLLIAISGGLDSVVLTQLLHKLNYTITLAHCNFMLRGSASDADEKFVKSLAKKLTIKVFTTQFDTQHYAKTHKLSSQLAARKLRYNWFKELIDKHDFDFVLTAHHADDTIETFLINLSRGTGLEGLTGIPAINGNIVRPLLPFSRKHIETYAKENNITWREDASNAETKYVRNKIRHEIVPKLKEINPNFLESFDKTLAYLQQSQHIIDDGIATLSAKISQKEIINSVEVIKFDIKEIQKLANPKAYLYQLLKKYNFTEWDDVHHLLEAKTGKMVVSKTHQLLKNRDFLWLTKIDVKTENQSFLIEEKQLEIQDPIHLKIVPLDKSEKHDKNHILVDKDLLKFPLIVRRWQKGDYFCPIGMQGSKKLSKYFKDIKLSMVEKKATWLLCNATNEIIWVIGKRQDKRFEATDNTKNTIQLNYKP